MAGLEFSLDKLKKVIILTTSMEIIVKCLSFLLGFSFLNVLFWNAPVCLYCTYTYDRTTSWYESEAMLICCC